MSILRGYQEKMRDRHIALLRGRFVTADRSETGTGKTPAILATVPFLKMDFVVVCPKSLISHWRHWVGLLGLGKNCLGVFGWEAAKLGCHPEIFHPDRGWFPSDSSVKKLIIFDESHRAKSYKTLNARMLRRAREAGHFIALLSATLVQSPLDLGGLAFPLSLTTAQRHWFAFAQRYGASLSRWRGYESKATTRQLLELHGLLDRVSVRVRKADVAPMMCINQVDLIDIDNAEVLTRIYRDLEQEIAELEQLENSADIILTARLRGRQAAELEKVLPFKEAALTHLEEGAKVCLFFNFNRSITVAQRLFTESHIPVEVITGMTSLADRAKAIASFNEGSLDVLLLNVAAGGEGISLHDAHGNKPRVCLISPPESAAMLIQAMGRVDRVGSKSVALNRVLFVANTVEENVYENVSEKISDLQLLNDGDLKVQHHGRATASPARTVAT